ncbi:MAG: hypothetical protein K0R50_2136 [Eubacterium sp.]|jgi:uncharacterized membrane protein|nr:hypothetical protein [Eubacterium sp.]
MLRKHFNSNRLTAIAVSLLIIGLCLLPTGFNSIVYKDSVRAVVEIVKTDNSNLYDTGIIKQGEQKCQVLVLDGKFKGMSAEGTNNLVGKLELDKIFVPGDKALAVIDYEGSSIKFVTLIDHYRINLELILFVGFIILLIAFAGWTGAKAILSFILSVVVIWKVLVPTLLKGWNPILISLFIVAFLTVFIISMVGGYNKKSLAAIAGSLSGTALSCILAVVFGHFFKIHGAIMAFSESLLYSGYGHLNLTEIFIAATFIASSGALMDVAVDIAAAVHELVEKNPEMSAKEAIKSGFNIGKVVMGTMTTTLLLAYSGGYIGLLMVFMAQGTPVINILNLKYVSAEIFHTLVGSFGLVAVAPFTAIISGIMFTKKNDKPILKKDDTYEGVSQ